jgi:hypothetical protein
MAKSLRITDDERAAELKNRHARDEAAVRSGRRSASALYAIPASVVKNSRVEFPKSAFATRRKSW